MSWLITITTSNVDKNKLIFVSGYCDFPIIYLEGKNRTILFISELHRWCLSLIGCFDKQMKFTICVSVFDVKVRGAETLRE